MNYINYKYKISINSRIISLLIFILLSFSYNADAQKKITEDVVYLKNGSIIRGKITENKPGEFIRIKTVDRSEWVFRHDEIEKTGTEELTIQQDFFTNDKGIYCVIYSGMVLRNGRNFNSINITNNVAAGYKFHRLIGVGGSAGIDLIEDIIFFPVALEIRGNFFNKAVTPYYAAQAGYSFPANLSDFNQNELSGGMVFNPSLGLQFSLSKDVAILLDAGIKIQKYHIYRQTWGGEINQDITLRRLTMRMGFIF